MAFPPQLPQQTEMRLCPYQKRISVHTSSLVRPTPYRENEAGAITANPSYIISHRITLEEAPRMYEVCRDKREAVTKIVVIDP